MKPSDSDTDQIAAFLARNGVTVVAAGVAYGVDREADKAKRAAERQRKGEEESAWSRERDYHAAHDAFFTGDKEEGYRLLSRSRG